MSRPPVQRPSVLVIGTYFGTWPVWFPAFLLSCARNETMHWLFFTDCPLPQVEFENIRFERLSLDQLNGLATARLGTEVRKNAFSQCDLRPTYGDLFAEHISGFDFWGHCDLDVVWGDLRRVLTDEILRTHDIVSFRKGFLAGHLTVWRNAPENTALFREVPAWREILSSSAHLGFDECIISTHMKSRIAAGHTGVRVYWPEQLVRWFPGTATPLGWSWRDRRVFDECGREQVYLHLGDTKRVYTSIDFGVGDQPSEFRFTESAIVSGPPTLRERASHLGAAVASVCRHGGAGLKHAARMTKRALVLGNVSWAATLAEHGVDVRHVRQESRDVVLLQRLGVRLDGARRPLLAAYATAIQLLEQGGAKFWNGPHGEWRVEIGGLSVCVRSAHDLHVLRDLFVDGLYNWSVSRPTVVVDVGMGAGLSSLYFARQPDVTVVGYEPCLGTFDRGVQNLRANPQLAARIRTVRAAPGIATYRTIAMHPPQVGPPGVRPSGPGTRDAGPAFQYEEIDVVDAAEVLDSVAATYPGRQLVLKVTYERSEYWTDGVSEYRLLERLGAAGKLDLVQAIFGRWGRTVGEDPSATVRQLRDAGFDVLVRTPGDPVNRMVYAVRPMAGPVAMTPRPHREPRHAASLPQGPGCVARVQD